MTRWVWLVIAAIAGLTVAMGPRGILLVWLGVVVVYAVRVITGRDPWSLRPGSSPEARRNGLASVAMVIAGGLIVALVLLPFSLPLYLALAGVGVLFVATVAYLGRRVRGAA
jgi:Na+/phosphate symporter